LHGNDDTKTNRVIKKIKDKFPNCILLVKQEKTLMRPIHFHLIIIYEHSKTHPASILKKINTLVTIDRSKVKQLVSYDIMESDKCKNYFNYKNLEFDKFDVWLEAKEERMSYGGKSKTYLLITKNKLDKIFCWISYLAKVETSYNKRSLLIYHPS
jgi:hypothetical protein